MQGGVFIHEIHAGGPAEKSARLRPGDRLTKVNAVDFTQLSHSQALEQLRSAQDRVNITFERRPGSSGQESSESLLYQDLTVTLGKKAGKGLGLSLVGRRDGPGVFISALVPGGVAENTGKLVQGDQIIKVNDRDLSNATQVTILPRSQLCLYLVIFTGRCCGSSQDGSW